MKLLLEHMTWPEVRTAIDSGVTRVIIPVASIEQHGYHLPEDTDEVLGSACALLTAEILGNTLVAPCIRPGISPHHMGLAGTVTLRVETFRMVLEDYVTCYARHGFTEIVFLASHGGNVKPCREVAKAFGEKYPHLKIVTVADVPTQDELRALEQQMNLPEGTNGGHADERETSEMLSIVPELVHMERAQAGFVGALSDDLLDRFFKQGVTSLTDVGCMGDPREAAAWRGLEYRRIAAQQAAAQITELLSQYQINSGE